MKRNLLYQRLTALALTLTTGTMFAQFSFVNSNNRLSNSSFHSGCTVVVADINGDGLDDIARLSQGKDLYVEYQKTGNVFQSVFMGSFSNNNGWAWGMCVGDFDHNGYKDVVAGGNSSGLKVIKIGPSGMMGSVITLPSSNFFVQNVNVMDVNGDGWEDVFACDDNAPSKLYLNDGAGNLGLSTFINFNIHPGINYGGDPADSGNYGSLWSDFDNDGDIDLYIAKCRQSSNSPTDIRRINQLFLNDGNNNYTESAATFNMAVGAQTWTANLSDIDNDGDFDMLLTNHDVPSQIWENDGQGYFTNITSQTGFSINITPIESIMEDFDNDGFVDILISGSNVRMFKNNGDKTFTQVTGLFPVTGGTMLSFATGDLNHDGKIDVYSSYGNIYTTPTTYDDIVWLNNTDNSNHFLTFNLIGAVQIPGFGTATNEGGLGARVTLYGPWGTQIREVRGGESYGTCNSYHAHFGLGQSSTVDSVVVNWPSGIVSRITNPTIDQFITIKENICVSPNNIISASGPLFICAGQNLTLSAATGNGYSYEWSTGATSQSINVTTPGEYSVKVTAPGNACTSISPIVNVVVSPDETPTVTVNGPLQFCKGGSVELVSSATSGNTWSNGASTNSVTITSSGDYYVNYQGLCQLWPSAPITVNVVEVATPTGPNIPLTSPSQVTLTASGTNLTWYDAPGGNVVGTGNSVVTPVINTNTTFYVQDQTSFGGFNGNVGPAYHAGTSFSGSTSVNADMQFTVSGNCTLKTVKTYTDTPGDRIIELKDAMGTVLQSITVNIPIDTAVIDLNFALTPGNYVIGTNSAQNNTLLGYNSPRLRRSNQGVSYPYTIANLVSITNSNQGSNVYYYFYDWKIEVEPTVCTSDYGQILVYFTTASENLAALAGIEVFPNPATDILNVEFQNELSGKINLALTDVSGRVVLNKNLNNITKGQISQINISELAKGVYVLSIENGSDKFTQKVVVK